MNRSHAERRWSDRRLALFIAVLGLFKGLVWMAMTPPLKIADEPTHFENIAYRAEFLKRPRYDGGGRPIGKVMHDGAPPEVFHLWHVTNRYFRGKYLPNVRVVPEEQELRNMAAVDKNREGDGQITSMAYPGVYYDLGVVAYDLFRHSSVIVRIYAVRFVSVLFGIVAAIASFLAARQVFDSRTLALTVGLLVMLQPMESQMTAAVNNDAAILGFGAVIFYLQLRFFREPQTVPHWRWGLLLGVINTLAILSKPHGYGLAAGSVFVCLALLYKNRRSRAAWLFCTSVALPLAVVVLAYQWQTHHEGTALVPSATAHSATIETDFVTFLSTLDETYQSYLFRSTFGQFGWLEYALSSEWTDLIRAIGGLTWYGFIAAIAARLLWPDDSRWLSIRGLLFSLGTVVFSVLFILYIEYLFRQGGVSGVIQGRSFLFAYPAAAIIVCSCWGALVPARFRTLTGAALFTCALALHIGSILLIGRYHYGS
ncbi:MAG: hypothetical protein JWM53_2985 [bacterium]|nr:hypothetical protein [bacterium]